MSVPSCVCVVSGSVCACVSDDMHPRLRDSGTNMTDRGMGAVADVAAHHPSLEKLFIHCEALGKCVGCGLWM